jgi:hypothetical protein
MDVLRIVLGKELGDRFGGSTSSVNNLNGDAPLESRMGRADKRKASSAVADEFRMDTSDNKTSRDRSLGEDARVLSAALSAVCNIVNDFSPLRPVSSLGIFETPRFDYFREDLFRRATYAPARVSY